MLSAFLISRNLTRDSVLWTVGKIAAVVVCLASLGDSAAQYGIPLKWLPFLRLGSLVVGIVSGTMSTSSLPGAKK